MRKYRAKPLGDIETGNTEAAWIVQASVNGKWMNCFSQDKGPYVFYTKVEAEAKISEIIGNIHTEGEAVKEEVV